jgi:hypothetical protein
MKKLVFAAVFLLTCLNAPVWSENAQDLKGSKDSEVSQAKSYQIVGKFVEPKKSLNLPYRYYFVYSNSKGQKLAFPIVNKSKLKMNKVDFSQMYHINVVDSEKLVDIGESKKSVKVLELVDGKMFNLADLSSAGKVIPQGADKPSIPHQETLHHPMFRINDNVANAAIFTAGAILLGSMLVN